MTLSVFLYMGDNTSSLAGEKFSGHVCSSQDLFGCKDQTIWSQGAFIVSITRPAGGLCLHDFSSVSISAFVSIFSPQTLASFFFFMLIAPIWQIMTEFSKLLLRISKTHLGTSQGIQWLKHCASNAGGPGSIPGQGTRSYMPQLRPSAVKYMINIF